jgi:hypothetical protein
VHNPGGEFQVWVATAELVVNNDRVHRVPPKPDKSSSGPSMDLGLR